MQSKSSQGGKPRSRGAATSSNTSSSSSSSGGALTDASSVAVPVTVVSSVAEFQSVFTDIGRPADEQRDAFLLCYEQPADQVSADGLLRFQRSVEEAARVHRTRLRLFLWNCGSGAFAAAKAQLEKQPGHPLLLIVFRGAIADTIRGKSLAEMTATEVPQLCRRLSSFQTSVKPARVVDGPPTSSSHAAAPASSGDTGTAEAVATQHLSLDVAKMVGMGKKLMAERKPFYAEKFFAKALQSLDAVAADVDRLVTAREDYDGSVALCLAWAGLAQLVQGKHTVDNQYLRRLCETEKLRAFREEPRSDACRAVATLALMQAAPRTWNEVTCSEAKLRAALKASPHDAASRSLLVVTLFLSGDLERAMTEALKLHLCGEAYGRVALKQMCAFLGHDHALVRQLGIPALLELSPAQRS